MHEGGERDRLSKEREEGEGERGRKVREGGRVTWKRVGMGKYYRSRQGKPRCAGHIERNGKNIKIDDTNSYREYTGCNTKTCILIFTTHDPIGQVETIIMYIVVFTRTCLWKYNPFEMEGPQGRKVDFIFSVLA